MLSLFKSTALDGTPNVPAVSVLCMATAIIMMIVVPIFAIRYVKKNYRGKMTALIYGIGMYCIFDLLVFNIVMIAWSGVKTIGDNDLFMAILAAVLSGLVGVVGRTIAIHALANSKAVEDGDTFGNAYMSGVGYGLLNIPLMLFSMFMNISLALMINLFGVSYVANDVGKEGEESLAELYEMFLTTPAYEFLLSGVRVVYFVIISMSVSTVIYAVYKKRVRSVILLIVAFLSILCMLPVYLNQYGILFKTSLSTVIGMTIFTAWIALFSYGITKLSFKKEFQELGKKDVEVKQKAFPDFNKNIKKDI